MRLPSSCRTCPGSNGSIMLWAAAMRRIHLSLLMLIFWLLVVLDDDLGKDGRAVLGLTGNAGSHLAGDIAVDRGNGPIRIGDHGGLARICLLADADVERQAAQELHVVVLAHLLAAAAAEDVLRVAAVRAD